MAATYNWPVFPVLGATNYYSVGYSTLSEWRDNMALMDANHNQLAIDVAEDIAQVISDTADDIAQVRADISDGSALSENSIPVSKLLTGGSPSSNYTRVYNAVTTEMEWQDIAAVVGADTYTVKMDSGSAPDFLEPLLETYLKKFGSL